MRMYDTNRGIRFGKNHPLWPDTQKGEPYKRQPNEKVLDTIKGINLVPSVTTFCACVNDGNEFSIAMNWVKSLVEGHKSTKKKSIVKFLEEEFVRQRDIGSDAHEGMERYVKGLELQSDIQRKAVDALIHLVDPEGDAEIQFASKSLGYGGTVDHKTDIIEDYKFTSSKRAFKPSELCQLAMYMQHFACDGRLIMCPTDTWKAKVFGLVYGSYNYSILAETGMAALNMWHKVRAIKKMAKGK